MRTEPVRSEVQRLLRQAPFRPFVMILENGQHITIEHPENIAFDPGANGSPGSPELYVITGRLRLFTAFDAVASVALADVGGEAASTE